MIDFHKQTYKFRPSSSTHKIRSPRKKRDGSAANSRSASASPVKAATPRAKRAREALVAAAAAQAAAATITKQVLFGLQGDQTGLGPGLG